MTEQLTCSVEEAAELLGVSRAWAYELARQGNLPVLATPGRRGVRVIRPALLAWIDRQGEEWLEAHK